MRRIGLIISVPLVLTALVAPPLAAQTGTAFPAAQPATDLESALYKAADALGMLRGPQERDGIVTFEYWANGSLDIKGAPVELTNYRASVRYPAADRRERFPVPAMRVDFTWPPRARSRIGTCRWWPASWPGTRRSPAATQHRRQAAHERLLQIWTLPQGVVKAARLAGAKATFATEGGKPVITFPLPAPLQNGTVKATLDPENFLFHTMPTGVRRYFSHRIERVETRLNNVVTVTTYSDYGD